MRMLPSTSRRQVQILLATGLVAVTAVVAGPAVAVHAQQGCIGNSCNGLNSNTAGCVSDAVSRSAPQTFSDTAAGEQLAIQLRGSPSCESRWARVWAFNSSGSQWLPPSGLHFTIYSDNASGHVVYSQTATVGSRGWESSPYWVGPMVSGVDLYSRACFPNGVCTSWWPSAPPNAQAGSTVTQAPFGTYAGYTAVAGGKGAFGLVQATWVVPQLSFTQCWGNVDSAPFAGVWVGLWGSDESIGKGTAWLPQVGTISSCNVGPKGPNLGRNYYAFWEMFTQVKQAGAKGHGSAVQPITSMTIRPGDTMFGDVEFEGISGSDLVYSMQLIDSTRTRPGSPDQFSITVTTTKPVAFSNIMAQGGAVVEGNCKYGLAQFTPVSFTKVQAASWGTPAPSSVSLTRWTMTGTSKATLAEAAPQSGFPGLMDYTVTYKTGGLPTTC
jgi:hypothetical protein